MTTALPKPFLLWITFTLGSNFKWWPRRSAASLFKWTWLCVFVFCLGEDKDQELGSYLLSTDHVQLPYYRAFGQENTNTCVCSQNAINETLPLQSLNSKIRMYKTSTSLHKFIVFFFPCLSHITYVFTAFLDTSTVLIYVKTRRLS